MAVLLGEVSMRWRSKTAYRIRFITVITTIMGIIPVKVWTQSFLSAGAALVSP